ncbi:MAG: (deoxy)nucleoside triphosphate pyrophosphohydrolase [Syntrophobacterales bacterium]|nr:MAG: (deoxy)nucleoside triphosphate pyrophosphohydrolase [Syntrophobacterales bacterium]
MNDFKIVTAGIVIRKGRVLVTKRTPKSHGGLLWEFPGGKMESGEDPKACVERELSEELDIEVKAGEILEVVYHRYDRYPILLLGYRCELKEGAPRAVGCHEYRWVGKGELKGLSMPEADKPIRDKLLKARRLLVP